MCFYFYLQITAQAGELIQLKSDLAGLKTSAGTGTGSGVNVQQLVKTIESKAKADIQKAETGIKAVQGMVTTLMTQVGRLSQRVSQLQSSG